jgi:hypothetical protein
MTIDLLGGCKSAQTELSCGLQSRRALSAVAKGSLGSRSNEAFQGNVEFAVEAADHFKR